MSEPWWEEFKNAILDGAGALAKDTVGDLVDAAKSDADDFLESVKQDMLKWAKMLKNGEITPDEFSDLVEAKEALAEIRTLTQAGIAEIKIDRFRSGLIKLVTDTALKML